MNTLSRYVWLLSDSQPQYFPANTASCFSNRISPCVEGDNIECALLSLDVESNFENQNSVKRYSYKLHSGGKSKTQTFSVKDNESLVDVFQAAIEKKGWTISRNGSSFSLKKTDPKAPAITLSPLLAAHFHLTNKLIKKDTSSRPQLPTSVYVTSNLVTPQYFGEERLPILASLSSQSLLNQFVFQNPTYHDVTIHPIYEIKLSLVDRRGKSIVLPDEFYITALLHFRTKQ